jgi:hypothetical protein
MVDGLTALAHGSVLSGRSSRLIACFDSAKQYCIHSDCCILLAFLPLLMLCISASIRACSSAWIGKSTNLIPVFPPLHVTLARGYRLTHEYPTKSHQDRVCKAYGNVCGAPMVDLPPGLPPRQLPYISLLIPSL